MDNTNNRKGIKMKNKLIALLLLLSASVSVAAASELNVSNLDTGSISFRPPSYPGNQDYGPGRTTRWYQAGTFRLPKLLEQEFTVNMNGAYVTEVHFAALDNSVNITSVLVELSNGQILNANRSTGTLRQGQRFGFRLDRYYSLSVERIIIRANSPNLIGSRASLVVNVGLGY